jgi:hypothetical protein
VTVDQLREAIARMPGHWPVHIEIVTNGMSQVDGKGGVTDYYYTLDCITSNFPKQGGMAVIRLNYEPT